MGKKMNKIGPPTAAEAGARGVDREVDVDFDTVVGLEGIDAWNDYLCELLGEPNLLNIGWEPVEGHPGRLRVTGYVEAEDN